MKSGDAWFQKALWHREFGKELVTTSGSWLVRKLWGDSAERQCGVRAAAAPLRWSLGGHLQAVQMWWPSKPWHPLPSTLLELRGRKRGWKSWHCSPNPHCLFLRGNIFGLLVARHLDGPSQELPCVPPLSLEKRSPRPSWSCLGGPP